MSGGLIVFQVLRPHFGDLHFEKNDMSFDIPQFLTSLSVFAKVGSVSLSIVKQWRNVHEESASSLLLLQGQSPTRVFVVCVYQIEFCSIKHYLNKPGSSSATLSRILFANMRKGLKKMARTRTKSAFFNLFRTKHHAMIMVQSNFSRGNYVCG